VKFIALLLVFWAGCVHAAACPVTVGTLTLNVSQPRAAGISPFLAFFDATQTTDSARLGGANNPIQDVHYTWSFGDRNDSGTGNWAYGSNPGNNSMNTASGPVAAHLYVLTVAGTKDTTYTVQVRAYDGTHAATCTLSVTAYAPSGSNGFSARNTTCVAASSTPVAGSGGCPSGAGVLRQSSVGTALRSKFGNGKRVLFKCGDTFTGSYGIAAGTSNGSIGAYGGCEGSTTNRPIFQNSSGNTLNFNAGVTTDIRVADIDFEDGTRSATAVNGDGANGNAQAQVQITLHNLNCRGYNACYHINQGKESGIVASVMAGMNNVEGVFWNNGENNCVNGSNQLNCGGTRSYVNVNYNAILGNSFDGTGSNPGVTWETLRVSACRFCIFANNTLKNASPGGAVFKIHSGNTWQSQAAWIGQYTEYLEISDNLFTGSSGAQLVEVSPQNNVTDERLRYVIFERNWLQALTGNSGGPGRSLLVSGVNETVRNNVFSVYSSDTTPPAYLLQVAQRGVEPVPAAVEVYNNTCYGLTPISNCVALSGGSGCCQAAAQNSWASNNLFYNAGVNHSAVLNNGTGNTASNNTTDSSQNPHMVNGSGNFSLMSDFKPHANYSGASSSIPNYFDAFGRSWIGAYRLGALSGAQ
jgi:hypothetical protein